MTDRYLQTCLISKTLQFCFHIRRLLNGNISFVHHTQRLMPLEGWFTPFSGETPGKGKSERFCPADSDTGKKRMRHPLVHTGLGHQIVEKRIINVLSFRFVTRFAVGVA